MTIARTSFLFTLGAAGVSALAAACISSNDAPPASCAPNANLPGSFVGACPDASFPQDDAAALRFDSGPGSAADARAAPGDAARPDDAAPPVDAGAPARVPAPPACTGTVTTDPSFGVQGIVNDPGVQDSFTTLAIQPDGKYLAATSSIAARYDAKGAVDATFGMGGYVDFSAAGVSISAFLPQTNGDVVAGGFGGPAGCSLVRLLPSGALDPAFGADGGFAACDSFSPQYAEGFSAVVQRPNGAILAAGASYTLSDNQPDMGLMQFDPNGIPDPAFGTAGKALAGFTLSTAPVALLLQPDGKLLLAGSAAINVEAGIGHDDLLVARLNVDGSLDTTFGTGGRTRLSAPGAGPTQLGLQSTGAILVAIEGASTAHGFLVVRLTPAGALDTTFGSGGMTETIFDGFGDESFGVSVYADDTFVLDGYASIPTDDAGDTSYQPALARYTAQGALDPTFGTNGKLVIVLPPPFDEDNYITAQALLPNGAIVVAGGASYLNDAGDGDNANALLVKYDCP